MKHNETVNVSGHLEIYKIFEDGTEQRVFDEDNTITSGMGVGLGLLYAGSGATDITNFQIRYFQLGVSGDSRIGTNAWATTSYGVSETMLASALGQVAGDADYQSNNETLLPVKTGQLMDWNGAAADDSEGLTDAWVYAVISDNSIKRVDLNSVTYILYVDRNSCNDLGFPLNEIGLFMKDPLGIGSGTERSPLVAYRPFTNIAKTDDFALVFKWTLNF